MRLFKTTAAAIAAMFLAATPSLAQNNSQTPTGASDDSRGGSIESIVVVARRRAEEAQDTPVTLSAFADSDLEDRQVIKVEDLQRFSPGLYIGPSSSNPFSAFAGFRGQFNSSSVQSLSPAINAYQNGIYLGTLIGFRNLGVLDVDRVEVLKGPQGTLYGRNTTGGAISFYTKRPVYEFEGEVSANVGNYDTFSGHAILNIPIKDDVAALRVVGGVSTDNGFAEDVANSRRLRDQTSQHFHATLLLEPTPNLEITLFGDINRGETGGMNKVPLLLDPNSAAALAISREAGIPVGDVPALFETYRNGVDNIDKVASSSPQSSTLKTELAAATIKYDLGPVELSSITAYRSVEEFPEFDFDGTPFELFESSAGIPQVSQFDQFTEEVTLSGEAFDGRLDYVSGVFYLDYNGFDSVSLDTVVALLPPAAVPTNYNGWLDLDSLAFFGQGTFALTPTLNLTGGLRWTKETRDLFVRNFTPGLCIVPAPAGVGGAPCEDTYSTEDKNLSYAAALDWSPSDGLMLYVKTDRGYRSGGVNQRTTSNPASVLPFREEVVDNYEIGFKSDFADNRLRVNAAYYHQRYVDIQQSVFVVVNGLAGSTIQNAAAGTIQGVELEVLAAPVDNLRIFGTAAFTDAHYNSFIDPASGADLSGRDFQLVAEWTYTIGATYTVPVSAGDLGLAADWFWKGPHNLFPSGGTSSIDRQEGYGLLNGQVWLDFHDRGLRLSMWAQNILDKRYLEDLVDATRSLGFVSGSYSWPRTYGVKVTKQF